MDGTKIGWCRSPKIYFDTLDFLGYLAVAMCRGDVVVTSYAVTNKKGAQKIARANFDFSMLLQAFKRYQRHLSTTDRIPAAADLR